MMIAYKTFSEPIKTTRNQLGQQDALRAQLATFINEKVESGGVIDICETAVPGSDLFTITVWYQQAAPEPDVNLEISQSPQAQSADVLSRSLHEHERRELVNTMVDEHLIRSSSQ